MKNEKEIKEVTDFYEDYFKKQQLKKKKNIMNKLLEKLELLFDEYYAEQLKLSDTPNADYYLFMGKTSGIGEATDLLKINIRDIMLEFGTFLTENEEVPDLIYNGKKIDFLLDKFIEETD